MKKVCVTLTLIAMLFCKSTESIAQVNVGDSLALVDLYNSTNGSQWTRQKNWLNGPVSTWESIGVTANRVTYISLDYNNLQGTIPSSIGNLSGLIGIQLTGNQIIGAIPSSIGNLVNLQTLDINENQLSGSIPSSIGKLRKLWELGLFDNQLTGQIPNSIGNILALESLLLMNNKLTGPIPSSLGNIPELGFIYLSNNQLSGGIPGSLGNIHGLMELRLDNNKLSGSIPAALGNAPNIQVLDVNNNILSGSIPAELGNTINLGVINVSHNSLSGVIPVNLRNLIYLGYINISYNSYTFAGLEGLLHLFPSAIYNNQAQIPLHQNGGLLYVSSGGTLSNNTYQWYRNNSLYKTIVGDSVFTPDVVGSYFVKVSNSIATSLVLNSDTIVIQEPCAVAPTKPLTSDIQSTSATLSWDNMNGAVQYQVKYKLAGGTFITLNTISDSVTLTGLLPNTKYTWKVRTRCSQVFSPFTPNVAFRTANTLTAAENSEVQVKQIQGFVFPNPANSYVDVSFKSARQADYSIRIYDIQGKLLQLKSGACTAGNNTVSLDIRSLAKGMYLVKLNCDNQTYVSKLIKQ